MRETIIGLVLILCGFVSMGMVCANLKRQAYQRGYYRGVQDERERMEIGE